jgi:signal transduction histidine kinase/PAS domain-containing protein
MPHHKPDFYRIIVSTMSEGFIIQADDLRIVEYNQAALKILGLTDEEMRVRDDHNPVFTCIKLDGSLFPYEEHPCSVLIRTGIPQNQVVMGIRHSVSGVTKWIQMNTVPFSDQIDGSPLAVLSTISDITQQIEKNRELDRREQQLIETQTAAHIGCWTFQVQDMTYTWTPEMFRIWGFPFSGEAPSTTAITDRVHPDDAPGFYLAFSKLLSVGEPLRVRFRIVNEGSITWVEMHGSARSVNGVVTECFGTGQDITLQISQESEKSLVMDALNIGMWASYFDPPRVEFDHRTYAMYGIDPASTTDLQAVIMNRIHPEDREEVMKKSEEVITQKKMLDMTFRILHPELGIRFIGAKGTVYTDANGLPMVFKGLNWDRTKQMLLEQEVQEEKLKALQNSRLASLGEMAGGVAHEINNPLTLIHSSVMILRKMHQKKLLSDVLLLENLKDIDDTVSRISQIVSGLRNLSRDSDSEGITEFSLREVLTDVLSICSERFRINDVDFKMDKLDPHFDLQIETRRVQLSQVLLNLFNNSYDAISALDEKWISIHIRRHGRRLYLVLKDSGSGIPQDIQEKIFNPFFTTKDVGKGTGLGLSLSKTLIERNGGQLYLDNDSPNTCFIIELPLVLPA